MKPDPRVDQIIDSAQAFAKPILVHLRQLIFATHPDLEETIKWNFPSYTFNGKIICFYSCFKSHCAFGYWQANLLKDPKNILERETRSAMGNFGRITTLHDLPSDEIIKSFIIESIQLVTDKISK